jgi:hypothetical protein
MARRPAVQQQVSQRPPDQPPGFSRVEELAPSLTVLSLPTSSVLSPKLALHPKSTIQILNPPKISKFCSDHHRHFSLTHPPLPPFSTTTTTTRFGHLIVIHHLSALNCDHVGAHLPSHANVDAMQAKQWFSPLVADQQKSPVSFILFAIVFVLQNALGNCCFVA